MVTAPPTALAPSLFSRIESRLESIEPAIAREKALLAEVKAILRRDLPDEETVAQIRALVRKR